MEWKAGVLVVLKEYEDKNSEGGAKRKLLDSHLWKWVYRVAYMLCQMFQKLIPEKLLAVAGFWRLACMLPGPPR